MPERLLKTCILPVGLNDHVATLLATTPGEPSSWFMQSIKLINPKTGKPLIPLLQTFKPCDTHAKLSTPWICTCNVDKRADWKSPSREEIWGPFWDDPAVFEAENRGIVVDGGGASFNSACVERLRQRPTVKSLIPPKIVYIAIDPAEGGKDEFAICAMINTNGIWVMIYGDVFHLKSGDRELQNEHVQACVRWIRNHPVYGQGFLVYICENAPGSRGGEMASELKNWANSVSMGEFGADSRSGVPKDPYITQIMTRRMMAALAEDGIAFAEDMATFTSENPAQAVAGIKQTLCNQMIAFRWDEIKKKLTGKTAGTGRDDFLVAAMMIMYWCTQFEKDPRYRPYRTRANSCVPIFSVMEPVSNTMPGDKRNYVTDMDIATGRGSISDIGHRTNKRGFSQMRS